MATNFTQFVMATKTTHPIGTSAWLRTSTPPCRRASRSRYRLQRAVYGACRLPGFGSHEVIIETPCHELSLPDLPTSHVAEVSKAYQALIKCFQNDSRFKFRQVYKNRGNRAVVFHNIQADRRGAQEFYDKHDKQCILCGVVEHETQKNRIRLIDENEHFITIARQAPSFPYETWLVPNSNFETISEVEIQSMAEMLKLTLRKINVAFGCLPYNYTLLPTFVGILTFYHILHLLGV